MTPEQREALLSGLLSLSDRVNDQHCYDLVDTVESLLAQARAEEREEAAKVCDDRAEWLRSNGHTAKAEQSETLAAAIRARKDA